MTNQVNATSHLSQVKEKNMKYTVQVSFTTHCMKYFEVEAMNEEQAKELAKNYSDGTPIEEFEQDVTDYKTEIF